MKKKKKKKSVEQNFEGAKQLLRSSETLNNPA